MEIREKIGVSDGFFDAKRGLGRRFYRFEDGEDFFEVAISKIGPQSENKHA